MVKGVDLKVRQLGIIDALGVESKRKRAIKEDSQVFDLDNRMHRIRCTESPP